MEVLLLNETDPMSYSADPLQTQYPMQWNVSHIFLFLLIFLVIIGNGMVIFAVIVDRKLRSVTTNKFIASLAVSDLLVGLVVMPLSLFYKMHDDHWTLGYAWCQFHLVSGVFSTTASIVHLVAISLDRYFAIMFPTEYQRHSISTSTIPYVVIIWTLALCVSSTLFMEQTFDGICWIRNPQYIVLSSFLSFFLPGAIVVYLYMKIFRKLRNHQLYMFGQLTHRSGERRHSLPRVIIEEVRSRRGSRMSQSGSQSGSPTRRQSGGSKERSPSQPDIHTVAKPQQRWRSPTICAETLAHDRLLAAKKRVSIVPDPPSMDVSVNMASFDQMKDEHHNNMLREEEMLNGDENSRRKKSEEEVRKLSNERKRVIYERRRSSTSDNPNGVPIMQAFHKAYQDVRAGRRRSLHETVHYPSLTTVHDDEGSETSQKEEEVEEEPSEEKPVQLHKLSSGSSIAETVIALLPKNSTMLSKTDSHDDSVSTEASQKPLLQPSSQQQTRYTKKADQKMQRYQPLIPAPTFLMVPAMMSVETHPLSPTSREQPPNCGSLLQVPKLFDCPSPCSVPSNSSHSSYTSASGSSDTYRRISMNSYGSSLTDGTESTFECDSRRSSAWSTIRAAVFDRQQVRGGKASVDITLNRSGSPSKKMSTMSRGKLRRIATQVTRAIRRKKRESMAIRRESRATRVVAMILIAFLICWIPYFSISIVRGVLTGFRYEINLNLHLNLFVYTSWLGYAHSCFNPLIYMCLNKNFRNTMRKLMQKTKENHE